MAVARSLAVVACLIAVVAANGDPPPPSATTTSVESTTTTSRPPQDRDGGAQQKKRDDCEPPCQPNVVVKQYVGRGTAQDAAKNQHDECCDNTADVVMNWLTAALALIALGGLYLQWRSTKAALAETRKASNAAARSADLQEQTLKESERPWILLRVDGLASIGTNPEGEPVEKPWRGETDHELLVVNYSVVNYGRGPGWITKVSFSFSVMPLPLPATPSYAIEDGFPEVALPSGVPHSSKITWMLRPPDHEAMKHQRAALVFHGLVVYRDKFRAEHVSRFCYVWDYVLLDRFPTFRFGPGGPKTWTEYT